MNFLFQHNIRRTNLVPLSKKDLPRATRMALYEYYEEDTQKIEQILNRKLHFWRE